ncbi:MAG: ATP-binding protein [Bacteroidales bacterium]|nr:ATP-binding protein [Bacteroidales bacterium]
MTDILEKKEISSEDIDLLLLNKAEESLWLEFVTGKDLNPDSEASINKISILVSAMANTGGGWIIYGIDTRKRRAFSYSFVDGNKVSKIWLKGILESRISRNIKNLRVEQVFFERKPEKSIILIKIPQSPDAPHMNWDYKFYKRSAFKEIVMEENEIRAAYLKTNVTEVEFFGIINTNGVPILSEGKIVSISFFPKFLVRNISKNIERNYKMEISIPSEIYDKSFTGIQEYFVRNEGSNNVFSVPNKNPLFQEELATVLEAKLTVNLDSFQDFANGEIRVKLFYSNGIKEHTISLSDSFRYKNRRISIEEFSRNSLENNPQQPPFTNYDFEV